MASNGGRERLNPRWLWTASARGLLGVMPTMDLRFFGFTVGWWFIGVAKAERKSDDL